MKILFVSSGNGGEVAPFVKQQSEWLIKSGVEIEHFLIKGRGVKGYLNNLTLLKQKLQNSKFDFIHAHFWASAALALLQFKLPVVVTYHGCDINRKDLRWLSNIFVSPWVKQIIVVNNNMLTHVPASKSHVIPCGIDLNLLPILNKIECREKLGLDLNKKYILFSSAFDRIEKNATLAFDAIKLLNDKTIELIEFKNYSYKQIKYLFNAVDLALLTSLREGSPQFIKEAMAFNIPIVTTNVGDVEWIIGNTNGCYITTFNSASVAEKINNIFNNNILRTNGRERIFKLKLDIESVTKKTLDVYSNLI